MLQLPSSRCKHGIRLWPRPFLSQKLPHLPSCHQRRTRRPLCCHHRHSSLQPGVSPHNPHSIPGYLGDVMSVSISFPYLAQSSQQIVIGWVVKLTLLPILRISTLHVKFSSHSHLGLSEHRLTLHLMVYHHFPSKNDILRVSQYSRFSDTPIYSHTGSVQFVNGKSASETPKKWE